MKCSEHANDLSQNVDWMSLRAGGDEGAGVMTKEYEVSKFIKLYFI